MISFEKTWSDLDSSSSNFNQNLASQESLCTQLQSSSSTSNLGPVVPMVNKKSIRRVISETTLTNQKIGITRSIRRRSTWRKSSEEKLTASSLNLQCDEHLLESPTSPNRCSNENRCSKKLQSYHLSANRSRYEVFGLNRHNIHQSIGSSFHLQRPTTRKRLSPDSLLNTTQRQFVVAELDKTIHFDSRCLQAMLKSQLVFSRNLQPTLPKTQKMRLQTVVWLKDVCTESKCDCVVLPLAISFMDRFLSMQSLPANKYQELGAACLLLASKMKAPIPLTPKQICDYTDHGVSVAKLLEWEIFVVNKLAWDLCTSTPFEFFDQILARIPALEAIRPKIAQAIYWFFQDEDFAKKAPSEQAALAVLYALGEYIRSQFHDDNTHQYCFELWTKVEQILHIEFPYDINTLRGSLSAILKKLLLPMAERHVSEQCAYHVLEEEHEEFHIISTMESSPMFATPMTNDAYRPRAVAELHSHTSDLSPSLYVRTERMFSSVGDIDNIPASLVGTSKTARYMSDDSGFNSEVTTPESARTTMVYTTTYVNDISSLTQSHINKKDAARRYSDCL